jgi:hypothetical protein
MLTLNSAFIFMTIPFRAQKTNKLRGHKNVRMICGCPQGEQIAH